MTDPRISGRVAGSSTGLRRSAERPAASSGEAVRHAAWRSAPELQPDRAWRDRTRLPGDSRGRTGASQCRSARPNSLTNILAGAKITSVVPTFHLLASPTRLRILELTWDRERSAGEIARATPVSFGAVSQQLRRLRLAGLITERRSGRQRFYRAQRESLGPIAATLDAMWRSRLVTLKHLAEAEEQSHVDC